MRERKKGKKKKEEKIRKRKKKNKRIWPFSARPCRNGRLDRYHPSILSETFPNRIYQHAGQTDRISNTFFPSTLPTIWDRLAQKGLRGRYYYSDLPFLALWGAKYVSISALIGQFYSDAAAGNCGGGVRRRAIRTGSDWHWQR